MIVLVALLFLEAAFLVQIFLVWPYSNIFSSILPSVLVDLTNNDRSENNVSALKVNPLLELAAQLKAQDMATKGYFEHTSPEGLTPWFWLQKVGYRWSGAGENLAVNFSDSSDIENAWMNSSGHRANILDNRFSEIGIATAKGIYKGQEAIFVVQFFGPGRRLNPKRSFIKAIRHQATISSPDIVPASRVFNYGFRAAKREERNNKQCSCGGRRRDKRRDGGSCFPGLALAAIFVNAQNSYDGNLFGICRRLSAGAGFENFCQNKDSVSEAYF